MTIFVFNFKCIYVLNPQDYSYIALICLTVINVFTFFMFGIDKWIAKKPTGRIRESALLGLAVLGSSVGAYDQFILQDKVTSIHRDTRKH